MFVKHWHAALLAVVIVPVSSVRSVLPSVPHFTAKQATLTVNNREFDFYWLQESHRVNTRARDQYVSARKQHTRYSQRYESTSDRLRPLLSQYGHMEVAELLKSFWQKICMSLRPNGFYYLNRTAAQTKAALWWIIVRTELIPTGLDNLLAIWTVTP